jgi:hypothetical protein
MQWNSVLKFKHGDIDLTLWMTLSAFSFDTSIFWLNIIKFERVYHVFTDFTVETEFGLN